MRTLMFAAVIVVTGWLAVAPATAASFRQPSLNSPQVAVMPVEHVGYWRRQYRRSGYPSPYIYYPPAYGSYPPPAAYAYPPAVYGYQPEPAGAYPPPVYGDQASPPSNGNYPSAEGDYGDYPPEEGDYPPAGSEGGEYPPDGS